jgi:sugar lactone lactonase YvrE/DNA-binding CsgD family transcriptional regulator
MKTPTRAGYHWTVRRWQPTPAQQRVLEGIAAGESNSAIAARLGLSPETVKSHVAVLLAETGCADRAELAQWWHAQQQVQVGDRSYPWLLLLALAALLLIGLALAAGLIVLLVAPGGARSHSLARRPATATAPPAATVPAEAATPLPAPSATPFPLSLPDPASSPTGNGPVVFLWATPRNSFDSPQQLAVDAQDNIYVVDSGNYRIVKLDPNGNVLTSWGTPGAGDGKFNFAPGAFVSGLAIDAQGVLYVIDVSALVQRFDSNGTFLGRWPGGGSGSAPGQFDLPEGLAVDREGRIYASDCSKTSSNNRIEQFTRDGSLLAIWGAYGTGPGEFNCPNAIAFDPQGNLYVVDHYNNRVEELDPQGNFVRQWGGTGSGPGQLWRPAMLALDALGNVYVTDNYNQRVEKFDAQGTYLGEWGSRGYGDGRFNYPAGIAIDSHGDIYIGDVLNGRIEKFRPR